MYILMKGLVPIIFGISHVCVGMALGVCVKVIDTYTCRHVHRENEEEEGEDVWVRPQGFSISSSLGDGYQWQHVIGIKCELEGCYH